VGKRRDDDPSVAGLVLVDKPAGLSSHDVVGRVRRALGVRRVGHSGTLDPPATGLLLVGVGWVTRVLRFTSDLPKTYEGEVVFGTTTTTLDDEGDVTGRFAMSVDDDALRAAMATFVGARMQTPPMVSAVKIGGRKLYDIARSGEEVERAARPVTVHDFALLGTRTDPDGALVATVRAVVSAGTYIRVLAAELGEALGGGAHLRSLRRTAIGPFTVEDAVGPDDVDARGRTAMLPPAAAAAGCSVVTVVDPADVTAVRNGRRPAALGARAAPDDVPTAVLDDGGQLLAVFAPDETGRWRAACVAPPPPSPA
jgi:tRNA pseudouridine55 synthase